MKVCNQCQEIYDETSTIELLLHQHLKPVLKKKKDSEKSIESGLRIGVEAKGGYCCKWVSPGNSGVTDRIVLLPNRVDFIETKTKGQTLDPLQEIWMKRIKDLGLNHYVIDTKQKLDDYLRTI